MHLKSDGLRLCSQLRTTENTRQMSLLGLIAEDDTDTLVKAFEIGINDYLVKPIDKNELLARAKTQVRRKFYHDRLRENYQEGIVMAVTDTLTGLHNRRYLVSHFDNLVHRAASGGKPVSVLMIDIDHFKLVNDNYGHQVGDEVLVEAAKRIRMNIRGVDLAVRYGGEEMVVVMPDTKLSVAHIVAERLTQHFADVPFKISIDPNEVNITVSMGVAVTLEFSDSSEDLLRRADDALYSAKRDGRNRVVAAAAR
jgi:two-component system cell cycle response regulator